ncbi:MAG TPA: ribonuclease HIII [Nitrospira sp.]|nr:ribonuclease HIII [Nitrospira sp.]
MSADITSKLESLLRQAQLHFPKSTGAADSKAFKEVYDDICRQVLNQQTVGSLWHEPLLLQLSWLFEKRPPNSQIYGDLTSKLKDKAVEARIINDLFFHILNNTSSAEDVYKSLSLIRALDQSLQPRFVASGYLEQVRSSDVSPSTKILSFLESLGDELNLDLLEQESVKGSLDSLKQREAVGRAYALLVRSGHESALVIPIQVQFLPGTGQVRCAVQATESFKVAVERAQMALRKGCFLATTLDVTYSLDLTDPEYTGSSIGLAAAAAMFTAQRKVAIDPYTAFTGDVNLEQDEWKVKSITGLTHKLSAARLNGCRRVFIPMENLHDVDTTETLSIIGVANVGEILVKLDSNPEPVLGDSIQAKKRDRLLPHCQAAGWALSDPRIIQNGVQYVIAPLAAPTLTLTIYDSGKHVPKEHPHQDYKQLFIDLAVLDQTATPIVPRQKIYNLLQPTLRNDVKVGLQDLKPEVIRDEQHCEYALEFKRGQERLVIKQYKSGKLQVQGTAGELYRAVIECIVFRYKLSNPTSDLSIEKELAEVNPHQDHDTKSSSSVKAFQAVPFPHIGTDESGKGDYYGPMVVAGVMVDQVTKDKLESLGVKDSKLLSDKQCRTLASQIRAICGTGCEEIDISPETYNRLYDEFKKEGKNLNHLLAWGHARAIESLLERHSCSEAIADQFGDEHYILSKLMPKGRTVKLTQLPKGERYIAVAAASILARDRFLSHLDKLSQEQGVVLPKGASDAVVNVGKEVVKQKGASELRKLAKVHHKTTDKVLKQ